MPRARDEPVRQEQAAAPRGVLGVYSSLTLQDIEREKARARLIASGNPIPNSEIQEAIRKAEETITRVEMVGDLKPEGHKIAQDMKRVLVNLEYALREKNREQEIQHIHESLMTMAKSTRRASREEGAAGRPASSSVDREEMKKVTADMRFISDAVLSSGALRKVVKKANHLLLESLSSDSGPRKETRKSKSSQQFTPGQGLKDEAMSITSRESFPRAPLEIGAHMVEVTAPFYRTPMAPKQESIQKKIVIGGEPHFNLKYVDQASFGVLPRGTLSVAGTEISRSAEERLPEQASRKQQVSSKNNRLTGKNTPHTRSNYKILLRGKELDFLSMTKSDESLHSIADELQDLMTDISNDRNLQMSIERVMDLYHRIFSRASDRISKYTAITDPDYTRARKEARVESMKLLENFAGGYRLQDLEHLIWKFRDDRKNDRELNDNWTQMSDFLNRSIRESDFVQSQDWSNQFVELLRSTTQSLEPHRQTLFRIIQEIDAFTWGVKEDRALSELAQSAVQLNKDLFTDESGRFKLKLTAINELIKLMIPVMRDQLAYIAIPEIRGSDRKMEYTVSNAVIRVPDLFPSQFYLENSNRIRVDMKDFAEVSRTGRINALASLHLTIRGVEVQAEDIHIRYHRLKFPRLSDSGYMNLSIPKGINFDIWLNADALDERIFHVQSVHCSVGHVKIYALDFEKHGFLMKLAKPFITSQIRGNIKAQMEDKVRKMLITLDERGLSGYHSMRDRLAQRRAQRRNSRTSASGRALPTSEPVAGQVEGRCPTPREEIAIH